MNIFRRLFRSKSTLATKALETSDLAVLRTVNEPAAPKKQDAIYDRRPGNYVNTITTSGTVFRVYEDIDELIRSINWEGRGALKFPTLAYGKVVLELMRKLETLYGRGSLQEKDIFRASLICAACTREFPHSYKLELQRPTKAGTVYGTTPGFREFGATGECPNCRGTDSIYIYEFFDPATINEEDAAAIRAYWRDRAKSWWQRSGRTHACCDGCINEIAVGEGYLTDSSLNCEQCSDVSVDKLKGDPGYYGPALLRLARPFKSPASPA